MPYIDYCTCTYFVYRAVWDLFLFRWSAVILQNQILLCLSWSTNPFYSIAPIHKSQFASYNFTICTRCSILCSSSSALHPLLFILCSSPSTRGKTNCPKSLLTGIKKKNRKPQGGSKVRKPSPRTDSSALDFACYKAQALFLVSILRFKVGVVHNALHVSSNILLEAGTPIYLMFEL